MLTSWRFKAIWECIKDWEIHVPGVDGGGFVESATGNHVRAILDALNAAR